MSEKNYIIAEVGTDRIIGKIKESLTGPEAKLLVEQDIVLVGPHLVAPLSGGPPTKEEREVFVRRSDIIQQDTRDKILVGNLDFFF